LFTILMFACGCSDAPPADDATIVVSILPLADFVERIAGENESVSVLVGPGQSPHTYEPTPQQMARLTRARVLFRVGVPFEERLIEKIVAQAPNLRVVDLRQNVEVLATGDHANCDHGHNDLDPHIWLDPNIVQTMTATIAAALVEIHPEQAGVIESNRRSFAAELNSLNEELTAGFAELQDRRFYVFHPAFGYFAKAYELTQVPVEIEGKEPSARMIAQFIDQARSDSVTVLFVQPQFSATSAEAIAEAVGCAVVSIDPLAKDYVANMRAIAAAILDARTVPASREGR
jgi:zinc transport system substrate-binding protein